MSAGNMALLGDIVRVQNGYAFPSKLFRDSGYPVVKIKNIDGSNVNLRDTEHIDSETFSGLSANFKLNYGDIVIAMTGARVGKLGVVPDGTMTPVLNQRVGRLIAHNNPLDEYFAFILLSTPDFQAKILGGAAGSAQPNISSSALESIRIPDLSDKQRYEIVLFIKSIDEKIELNRKMNETLEQMGQALFRHYFIDNPEAEGWKAGTVDHLFTLTMGLSPKGGSYNNTGDGVLLLNGAADFTGASITPKRYTSSPTRISRSGDIIFCIRGTIGNVCIGYEEYCLGRGVAAMTPTKHAVSYVYFSTIRAIAEMESAASGSVIRGLSKDDIAKRKVNLPPEDILKTFEAKALPLIEGVRVSSEEIQTLTALRDTLLPRLISGRIKINGTD